jgi:hypothetical protein
MKTKVTVELTEEDRHALADLLDGKSTTRLATRKDITALTEAFFRQALLRYAFEGMPEQSGSPEAVASGVIEDINRGSWTFIGQPALPTE